jgi:hypothetical protein
MGQILTPGYVYFDGVKFIITTPTIVGPPGPTGAAGAAGPQGPTGSPGSGSGTIISSTSYTADNTMGPVDGYSLVSIIMGSSPPTIQLADANASSTRPAIGAVQSISGGVAYLQSEGELPGFSGLIVGHQYYLSDSVPGTFTINAPTAVGSIVQKIGFAKTSTIFDLEIDADFTLL